MSHVLFGKMVKGNNIKIDASKANFTQQDIDRMNMIKILKIVNDTEIKFYAHMLRIDEVNKFKFNLYRVLVKI
jgi:hypothetical protein